MIGSKALCAGLFVSNVSFYQNGRKVIDMGIGRDNAEYFPCSARFL